MSQELINWLIGLGSFLVLCWTIRRPVKFMYQMLIKTHDFLEEWFGSPEHPGMPDRMKAVEKTVGEVKEQTVQQSYTLGELRHELKPNGGSSMNDRLTRVEKHLNPEAPDNH
jgi:hypothetical protein